MEDLAESELLEDESDSDLLAYQRLAFGRLRLADEHEQTGSNRFSEISPRVTYRVQTVPSKHVQYLFEFCPSRLKKYFFYKIFGNLPQISVALLSAAILASSGFTEKCAPAFQN